MIQTQHKVHFKSGRRSRKELAAGVAVSRSPGRLPRVTKLMALAIRLDQLIRDEHVADQGELARLAHVSRARPTQIMNLLNLAPCIQEAVLLLDPIESGRASITERDVRPIAAEVSWERQREMWKRIFESNPRSI